MVGAFGSNDAYADFRGLQDQVRELGYFTTSEVPGGIFSQRPGIQFRRLTPMELPDYQSRVERIRAEIVSLEQMVRAELAVPNQS